MPPDAFAAILLVLAVLTLLALTRIGADFAIPVGYQTNLMVYGPGGYRFSDDLRVGLPLNALVAGIAMLVIPWVWRF